MEPYTVAGVLIKHCIYNHLSKLTSYQHTCWNPTVCVIRCLCQEHTNPPPPCWVLMLTCQGDCTWVTYEGSFWAASYIMAICCCLCDSTTDGGTPQHPPCQLSAVVCSQVHLWHRTRPTRSLRPGTYTGSHRCSTLWTPCYSEWGCLFYLWRHTPPAGKVIKYMTDYSKPIKMQLPI